MADTGLLRTIRTIWIDRTTLSLAQGAGLRQDVRDQLERFFDLLEQVIESGDPAWLDPTIADWASSLTQTDLESTPSSLTVIIKEMMQQANQAARERLNGAQALQLMTALNPAFMHAFERAAALEMQARVDYISRQLAEAQQTLERLDRSKSDFIAVAAHELKTPLTLIEGYTAMLRETRDPRATRDSGAAGALEGELLDGINIGTRRLKTIIEDMIDVSLIDNNLLQLNFQPVWINRILAPLKTELAEAAQERGLRIDLRPFPGSDEMTFGDPDRLMQVFRHVLTNAVKFTPDGGCITVDGRKLAGFIEVAVSDTGIGIAPEDQGIIFDKFTRLGSSALHSSGKTKFKGGGPGLGLHIARGIIESHGGAIWVESPGYDEEQMPGSTFHIMLPQRSEPPDTRMALLLSPLLSNASIKESES